MNECMYVCVGDFENMANIFPLKVKLLEFTLQKIIQNFPIFLWKKLTKIC
jgi:hypothetical protein